MKNNRVIFFLVNLGSVFCLVACIILGVLVVKEVHKNINSFKKEITNLISPSFTVANNYEINGKASFIKEITSNKVLISYNNSIYKLVLFKSTNFIEGQDVNIIVRFTEMESGSIYSTITDIDNFKVTSCIKVIE